jgi:hypothetical protein
MEIQGLSKDQDFCVADGQVLKFRNNMVRVMAFAKCVTGRKTKIAFFFD